MKPVDLILSSCSQVVTCSGPIPKRRSDLSDIAVIEKGGVASYQGEIVFAGETDALHKTCKLVENGLHIDARGLTALPGLIDPHTHLPFAGTREEEFLLRLKGYSYQQLAEKGMGIQTTVKATREIPLESLKALCLSRLDSMLLSGTTTIEAKSGYGLNQKDEIKQLQALKEIGKIHPIDIIPTFMGAHEVPQEYRNKKEEYINLLIEKVMPEIKKKGLAEFFDVFCEKGVYSVQESKKLIQAAKRLGFKIKIHADEFASLGGAELAVDEEAVSAEHLIAVSENGINKLAESSTASVLLPGVPFFLMQEKKAPARRLIDQGAIVALATDFNPGSSMTESMLFILRLGVFTLKMSIEEAIHAATANAAYALDRQDEIGSIEIGKSMDVILCDIPHYAHLVYHMSGNPVRHVIKNGNLVVKNGMRLDPKSSQG